MQYFYKNADHALLLKGYVTVFFHPHVCGLKFNLIQFLSREVLNAGVYTMLTRRKQMMQKSFKFIGMIILIGVYKSKTQDTLQL